MPGLRLLSRFTAHEFIEVAALSACRRFLIQQCQTALVEFVEPVVPGDLFERSLAAVTGEIDAQNANVSISSCIPHTRRASAALLRPLADFVMIGSRSAAC